MVKISSDLEFKLTHVTPRGERHVGRVEQLRHVDLIKNSNVGNVYTDIKVYNKPSFCSKLIGNVVVLIHLCWNIRPFWSINLLTSYILF